VTVPMFKPHHRLRAMRSSRRVLILALSLGLAAWPGWWAFAIFWIFAVPVWIAFFMPTWCGAPTRDGSKCRRRARGWLGTCYGHRQAMYKALWAKVRPSNPAAGQVHRGPCRVKPRPVAAGLLAAAARLLPAKERLRYAEEFRSELWEIAQAGGRCRAQLAYAARQLLAARRLRAALRAPQRRGAVP
jgi:hypothetical protein